MNDPMLSQTTEYALRAVVVLCSNRDKAWKTSEIADIAKVPSDYLSKVLQQLARSDLVVGSRGAQGGFRLARDPEKLSILEVVNAVDTLPRIHKCPLGLRSHGANLCPLHRRIDQAMKSVEEAFGKSTIAELVSTENQNSGASRPCDFPLRKEK